MKVLVITGNIASGKSFLLDGLVDYLTKNSKINGSCQYIKSDDYIINLYKSEKVVRTVSAILNIPIGKLIQYTDKTKAEFTVDKGIISDLIFSSKALRLKLQSFLFSYINKSQIEKMRNARLRGYRYFLLESPLFFENRRQKYLLNYSWHSILVTTPVFKQRNNFLNRTSKRMDRNAKSGTVKTFHRILKTQRNPQQVAPFSDVVFTNYSCKFQDTQRFLKILKSGRK